MQLTHVNGKYTILDETGKVFYSHGLNVTLIYLMNQCNIEETEVEKAFSSMYENEHNVVYFGRLGGFLFSEQKEVIRDSN